MSEDVGLFRRHAQSILKDALEDTRVVVLNGPRQSGKSTLARMEASERPGSRTVYLDDDSTRSAAVADPTGLTRRNGLLVIDEVQRVPDLMLSIKNHVDLDPRPGRFLLTGSARLLALASIPDLLPGRTETIELWPLSQGEIDGAPDGFVSAVFAGPEGLEPAESDLRRSDYVARALRGGYPEAVRRRDAGRRARFFASYVTDLIHRDVQQVTDIERVDDLRRLIALLAAQMATLVVPGVASKDLSMPSSTLKRYLDLLELVFVVRRIPAWSSNLTTRAISTPKTLFVDSGLGGHLAGLTARRAQNPSAPVGPLLENFVLGELARQLTWADDQVRLYHYRDRDGHEVDAVLEHSSGELVAVEVKSGETVRSDDFRGISALQRKVGDRLLLGVVLHTGSHVLSFGERLRAWPISTLWRTAPPSSI